MPPRAVVRIGLPSTPRSRVAGDRRGQALYRLPGGRMEDFPGGSLSRDQSESCWTSEAARRVAKKFRALDSEGEDLAFAGYAARETRRHATTFFSSAWRWLGS